MDLGTIHSFLKHPWGVDSTTITHSVSVIVYIAIFLLVPGLNLNIFHLAHVIITVRWDLNTVLIAS